VGPGPARRRRARRGCDRASDRRRPAAAACRGVNHESVTASECNCLPAAARARPTKPAEGRKKITRDSDYKTAMLLWIARRFKGPSSANCQNSYVSPRMQRSNSDIPDMKVSGRGMRRSNSDIPDIEGSISDISRECFTLAAMGQTDIALKSERSISDGVVSSDKTQFGKSSTTKDSPLVKERQSFPERSLLSNRKWEVAPNSDSGPREEFSTCGPAWKNYSRRRRVSTGTTLVERSPRLVIPRTSLSGSELIVQSTPFPHTSSVSMFL
jgi:hypothetical protein